MSGDGVLAARVPAPSEPTDVKPAKNPAPAMMQPLGAIPTKTEDLAPLAEPTQPQSIVAEREAKRDRAELARRRRQARARAQAAAAQGEAPATPPVAAPEAPVAPPAPAEGPTARAAEDAPVPSGDDSYPEYLKRNGWRPLRDVLTEIDKSHPEPPQRAAPPEAEAPPAPAPPPVQEPAPQEPGGGQPEP
jgi:hypothetical protein